MFEPFLESILFHLPEQRVEAYSVSCSTLYNHGFRKQPLLPVRFYFREHLATPIYNLIDR